MILLLLFLICCYYCFVVAVGVAGVVVVVVVVVVVAAAAAAAAAVGVAHNPKGLLWFAPFFPRMLLAQRCALRPNQYGWFNIFWKNTP